MNATTWVIGFAAWCAVGLYIRTLGHGTLFVIISGFVFIFTNLSDTTGQWSAWSVFNRDFRQMPGTLTMGQVDAQLRHKNEGAGDEDVHYTTVSDSSDAFSGEGRRLGKAPSRPATAFAAVASSLSRAFTKLTGGLLSARSAQQPTRASSGLVRVDAALPTTSVVFRLDGLSEEAKVVFNPTCHTVGDLLQVAHSLAPCRGRLLAGFPPRPLVQMEATKTLQEAGLVACAVREVPAGPA